ncbi:MAG: succinate-semialdehyde dehydrogenase [Gammaproteobacteria bacterium]|nr:MAG: succinate-semialdehyde dehydrogenase [Gammaproteobacteria bacterium]
MRPYQVTNPATGKVIQSFDTASDEQIQATLADAHRAFQSWKDTSIAQRKNYLLAIAEQYRKHQRELAEIVTEEMGKPIRASMGEVGFVISIIEYYAQHGESLLSPDTIAVAKGTATVLKRPLGVLFGIMPWNYPHYQVIRFLAPNLMAGNTVILKHAEQCPKTAQAIEQLLLDAGLPKGVYSNTFASIEQSATIIKDPRVQAVSLTGSERAGQAVATTAGQALKKVVLELGGSDAFILCDDINQDDELDKVVKKAISARYGNCGQACNAGKRFIIMENVYDAFMSKFIAKVQAITPADPTLNDTFMGPMSSRLACEGLQKQVNSAIKQGATVLVDGGMRADNIDGQAWFDPMVLTDVTPSMDVYHQELFGPVAVVHKVSTIDEAIALANDVPYGLGASIHTNNSDTANYLAEKLDVGMVTINDESSTEAETPFGGVKLSGFGRELGDIGITEFLNFKLIRDKS